MSSRRSCSGADESQGAVTPRRVQLSRKPGWRKPPGAVVVSRPTRWGNPYPVATFGRDRPSLCSVAIWLITPSWSRRPDRSWPARTWRAGASPASSVTPTSGSRSRTGRPTDEPPSSWSGRLSATGVVGLPGRQARPAGSTVPMRDQAFGQRLASHSNRNSLFYKTAANRPAGAGACCPCSSGRVGRPVSAFLWGRVVPGGMTSRMTPGTGVP
jgi:hypothetical protein